MLGLIDEEQARVRRLNPKRLSMTKARQALNGSSMHSISTKALSRNAVPVASASIPSRRHARSSMSSPPPSVQNSSSTALATYSTRPKRASAMV